MAKVEQGANLYYKLEPSTSLKESLQSCLMPSNLVNVLLRCQDPRRSSCCRFKKE